MSEFDSSAAVLRSRAQHLARLLASGAEPAPLWQPGELAAIFRHQLAAPLLDDLGPFAGNPPPGPLPRNFGELLQQPTPARELLELVKDFAKANLEHPASGLPGEIAAAIYYSSIAAALVRLNVRISQLSDPDLDRGVQWTLSQSWLDEPTRELLAAARRRLAEGKGGARE